MSIFDLLFVAAISDDEPTKKPADPEPSRLDAQLWAEWWARNHTKEEIDAAFQKCRAEGWL